MQSLGCLCLFIGLTSATDFQKITEKSGKRYIETVTVETNVLVNSSFFINIMQTGTPENHLGGAIYISGSPCQYHFQGTSFMNCGFRMSQSSGGAFYLSNVDSGLFKHLCFIDCVAHIGQAFVLTSDNNNAMNVGIIDINIYDTQPQDSSLFTADTLNIYHATKTLSGINFSNLYSDSGACCLNIDHNNTASLAYIVSFNCTSADSSIFLISEYNSLNFDYIAMINNTVTSNKGSIFRFIHNYESTPLSIVSNSIFGYNKGGTGLFNTNKISLKNVEFIQERSYLPNQHKINITSKFQLVVTVRSDCYLIPYISQGVNYMRLSIYISIGCIGAAVLGVGIYFISKRILQKQVNTMISEHPDIKLQNLQKTLFDEFG